MIVDAHVHVWETWPYQPEVPDPSSRARAEQLLYEMDAAGVDQAIVICAAIGANPRNTDYAFEAASRHSDRLVVFPDLECRWSPLFRTPGAAERLQEALVRWAFSGFTVYLDPEEDGSWLTGSEGREFFALATEEGLLVSLSALPHQMPAVGALAGLFPGLVVLCHHMGHLGPRTGTTRDTSQAVLDLASHSNVFMKVSGMGNVAAPEDEFPYERLGWIVTALRENFGAERLVWGSDYPVSRRYMTYAQTLSLLQRHSPFTTAEYAAVAGKTMNGLLTRHIR